MSKQTLTLLAAALLLAVSAKMHAQVTIGADTDPKDFSLLEIVGDNSNGLRLPQMTGAEMTTLKGKVAALTDKSKAKGLMVMNTTANTLETFDGVNWTTLSMSMGLDGSNIFIFLYGYNSSKPYDRGVGVSVANQVTASNAVLNNMQVLYTNGDGKQIPDYTSKEVNGLTISYPATTLGSSGTIPLTLSGTPTKRGAFDIPVFINRQVVQVRVHVGCGMYTANKNYTVNWLPMMCINWGGTNVDYTLNPFTPVQGIAGDNFQWGKTAAVANVTTSDKKITPWSLAKGSNPQFYNSNTANTDGIKTAIKTANDPCPDGWRLPTRSEWMGGMNTDNNTQSRKGTWSGASTTTNYSAGLALTPVGSSTTITLVLPAVGNRASKDGVLENRGVQGWYMTSTQASGSQTIADNNNYYLNFSNTDVQAGNYTDKANGFSVRCVSVE